MLPPSSRIRTLAFSIAVATLSALSIVTPSVAQAQPGPSVGVVETDMFGPILVDRNGMTLYTWVNDEPSMSTCYATCALSWPPAVVDGPAVAPADLPGKLGTTTRTDGATQLTYNDMPLYRFSRDAAPGEMNGDGSLGAGGLWPVVPTGAVSAAVSMGNDERLGPILVDANGRTLYTWEADVDGVSTCYDQCATAWPPVLAGDHMIVGAGLSKALGTVARDDGTMQVTFKGMPLYTFFRDTAPGDVNGEGSMGFGALWSVAIMQIRP